jgi:hypothetical protein
MLNADVIEGEVWLRRGMGGEGEVWVAKQRDWLSKEMGSYKNRDEWLS